MGSAARAQVIDQVWIGGAAHDISDIGHGKESNSSDVLVEVDSTRPALLRAIGAPRINGTLAINASGLASFGAAGLTWDRHLFGPIHGSVDLGLGYSNGVLSPPPGPPLGYIATHRLLLGSHLLFREAVGLDWRFNSRWSLGAEYIHGSNGLILAKLHNEGINDAGLRLGYRFR
jgi:hypothetical protein